MDREGNDHGLLQMLIQHFPGDKKTRRTAVGMNRKPTKNLTQNPHIHVYSASPSRFTPRYLPNTTKNSSPVHNALSSANPDPSFPSASLTHLPDPFSLRKPRGWLISHPQEKTKTYNYIHKKNLGSGRGQAPRPPWTLTRGSICGYDRNVHLAFVVTTNHSTI
jgi:hypothetical protein